MAVQGKCQMTLAQSIARMNANPPDKARWMRIRKAQLLRGEDQRWELKSWIEINKQENDIWQALVDLGLYGTPRYNAQWERVRNSAYAVWYLRQIVRD